jgi:endonuclease-8
MPEGDSIHRLARELAPLAGDVIEVLALPRKNVPHGAYAGRSIESVEAQGKNLLVHLEGGVSLRVHLKMNGRVRIGARVAEGKALADPSVVAVLATNAHLVVVRDAPVAELVRTRDLDAAPDAQRPSGLGGLGPDVLADDFDPRLAAERWHRARHPTLAEALLDQGLVAGIGNEWKSELCFVASVDPFRAPGEVPIEALVRLAEQAASRLRLNVERRPRLYPIDRVRDRGRLAHTERTARDGPRSVYDRAGQACYRCGARIEMKRHGQPPRSTYFCPGCQK